MVAKRLPGFELPVVNPGVEAGMQDIVDGVARARPSAFGQGERQQPKQCRAPGKRLAYGIGEPQILTSGQNEEAVPPRLVRLNLQAGEEIWDALDFIQDGSIAKPRKKAPRIGFREFPLISPSKLTWSRCGKAARQSVVLSDCLGPVTVTNGYCSNSLTRQGAISRSIMAHGSLHLVILQVPVANCAELGQGSPPCGAETAASEPSGRFSGTEMTGSARLLPSVRAGSVA